MLIVAVIIDKGLNYLSPKNESLKWLYLRTGSLVDQQEPADLTTSPSI